MQGMKETHIKFLIPAAFAVPGTVLAVIGWITYSMATGIFAGMFFGFGLCFSLRMFFTKKGKRPATATQLPHATQSLPIVYNPTSETPEPAPPQTAVVLGFDFWREKWHEAGVAIDKMLDIFIGLIGAKLSHNTIAVFLPAPTGNYVLKRHNANAKFVCKDAMIIPRRGILGNLLSEGLRPYYQPNFTNDTKTLYYYDENHEFTPEESIRSIMLHPIGADGQVRGILLVDNTQENAYAKNDEDFLANAAKFLGTAIYNISKITEYDIDLQRHKTMSDIADKFWTNLNLDAVMDSMVNTIPLAIPCDRLTISLKDEGKMSATIKRAYGLDADDFHGLNFPLGSDCPTSIASLAYDQGTSFFRNYSEGRDEIRYMQNEPESSTLASFMAVPFGGDSVQGLMLLESATPGAFSKSKIELLSPIGKNAGKVLEKIATIQKVKDMATHDELTGIYNRRYCLNFLDTKIKSCARRAKPQLTLVMGDIDFFKKINDTYHHATGDIVIKGVAAKLNSSIRTQGDMDIAARIGGEEFVMILDDKSHEEAKDITDRIRLSIENTPFYSTNGQPVKVTMSFGVASYPEHATDIETLMKYADKALYRAKESGRNRVEVY